MDFKAVFKTQNNPQKKYFKRKRVRYQEWILEILSSLDKDVFELVRDTEKTISFYYKDELVLNLSESYNEQKKIEFLHNERVILRFQVERDLTFTPYLGDYYSPQLLFEGGDYGLFVDRFYEFYELVYAPMDTNLVHPTDIFNVENPMRKILLAFYEVRKGRYEYKHEKGVLNEEFVFATKQDMEIRYAPDTWLLHDMQIDVYENRTRLLSVKLKKDGKIKNIEDEHLYLDAQSLVLFKLSVDRFLKERKTSENKKIRLVQDKEAFKKDLIQKMNSINENQEQSAFKNIKMVADCKRDMPLSNLIKQFPYQEGQEYLRRLLPLFEAINKEVRFMDVVDLHEYEKIRDTRVSMLVKTYVELNEEEQKRRLETFLVTLNNIAEELKDIQSRIDGQKVYEFDKQVELNRRA